MSRLRVPRLVITSAYPIVATTPRLPIAVLKRILADAYADLEAMERVVTASPLDWRIVRLNRLTDSPRGGTRISRDLFTRPTAISRVEAAATLLDIAGDDTLRRTALNVAGPAPGRAKPRRRGERRKELTQTARTNGGERCRPT